MLPAYHSRPTALSPTGDPDYCRIDPSAGAGGRRGSPAVPPIGAAGKFKLYKKDALAFRGYRGSPVLIPLCQHRLESLGS